jgi:hypothetical protein
VPVFIIPAGSYSCKYNRYSFFFSSLKRREKETKREDTKKGKK